MVLCQPPTLLLGRFTAGLDGGGAVPGSALSHVEHPWRGWL